MSIVLSIIDNNFQYILYNYNGIHNYIGIDKLRLRGMALRLNLTSQSWLTTKYLDIYSCGDLRIKI